MPKQIIVNWVLLRITITIAILGTKAEATPPPSGPPPISSITQSQGQLDVAWPAIARGVVLEGTMDFSTWTTLASPISQVGTQRIAAIAPAAYAQFFRLRSGPSLTDFWAGHATWVGEEGALGHDFGMHALSIIRGPDALWAYYITNRTEANGQSKSATGRASSGDGITWLTDGIVVDTGGAAPWVYQTVSQPFHATGRAESNGWSATPSLDQPNFLVYGPYATYFPTGQYSAKFELMIDQNLGSNDPVAAIEVVNGSQFLARRQLYRNDFWARNAYLDFTLFFTAPTGATLEFRTYWNGAAYIKQDFVAVAEGWSAFWDDRIASFSGIWRDGSTYYLVYEGAGQDIPNFPGDIGLATSTDGLHFAKYRGNPILRHNSSGWESGNIGTPSLFKTNGTWFLFYHGYDGSRANIGVATGTALTNLVKYAANPVLGVTAGSWDSGAVGKRSTIYQEGPYYYFAHEGSTEPPFDTARWSTGLARSTDLIHWQEFSGSPIIPQTVSSYGYDAPDLVEIAGSWYLYVRMSFDPEAPTQRFRLVPK